MGQLRVHRKGYKYYSHTNRKYVTVGASTFPVVDRGASGRGKRVLPPARFPRAMTAIALNMGFSRTTDVTSPQVPEFIDRLINAYGEQSARGMIQSQITYRKRSKGPAKAKFEEMMVVLNLGYKGDGWTPPGQSL